MNTQNSTQGFLIIGIMLSVNYVTDEYVTEELNL